ncbi:MAG: methyl-accepting chemotaxis protein, partial [Comamonadaceae bacterium]
MKTLQRLQPELLWCLAFGLISSAAVCSAAGLTWLAGVWTLVLLALSALLGIKLHALGQAQQQSLTDYLAAQARFGEAVIPVWQNHIDSSRSQMESAVNALSDRFGGIVDKLDVALRTATQATDSVEGSGVGALFTRSETDLRTMVSAQEATTSSMENMLSKVQGLDRFIVELQDMASDVARIAQQTNLLA